MKGNVLAPGAAVAAADHMAVGAADPMADLEPQSWTDAKRAKVLEIYVPIRGKNSITAVSMPELERTTHPECEKKRRVRIVALSTTHVVATG